MVDLCPQVGLQVSAAGWAPGSAGGMCASECGRVSWSVSESVWVLEWMCCWGTAVGVAIGGRVAVLVWVVRWGEQWEVERRAVGSGKAGCGERVRSSHWDGRMWRASGWGGAVRDAVVTACGTRKARCRSC